VRAVSSPVRLRILPWLHLRAILWHWLNLLRRHVWPRLGCGLYLRAIYRHRRSGVLRHGRYRLRTKLGYGLDLRPRLGHGVRVYRHNRLRIKLRSGLRWSLLRI
jgi:hypothetical protein